MRNDGRAFDQMRNLTVTRNFLEFAKGSVLIEMGKTRVICAATIEKDVPPFLKGTGSGWLTGEYSMLPAATPTRNVRESSRGKKSGRTHEIQRLIGRSLRAVTKLSTLGERTITIDCDVIQADGGTRTAAITGSFIALVDACRSLGAEDAISEFPVKDYLAAISVGLLEGEIYLDLNYEEDSRADVDMNVVMTGSGKLIEVQGTAEGEPFDRQMMNRMMDAAAGGIEILTEKQRSLIGSLEM